MFLMEFDVKIFRKFLCLENNNLSNKITKYQISKLKCFF